MTREEMLRNLENVYELYKDRPVHTFEINIASMIRDVISFIKENTKEPNEDLISREAVIEALEYEKEMLNRALDNIDIVGQERKKFAWGLGLVECFIEDIKKLRREEPKHGKWLDYLEEGLKWKCSECGSKFTKPWNYCPNCGSYNGGDEE